MSQVKPYKQLVRYAVRGLLALDKAIPADVHTAAVGYGLAALTPRFINSLTADLINQAYPGLFDDDDVETFRQRFIPATSLEDL